MRSVLLVVVFLLMCLVTMWDWGLTVILGHELWEHFGESGDRDFLIVGGLGSFLVVAYMAHTGLRLMREKKWLRFAAGLLATEAAVLPLVPLGLAMHKQGVVGMLVASDWLRMAVLTGAVVTIVTAKLMLWRSWWIMVRSARLAAAASA